MPAKSPQEYVFQAIEVGDESAILRLIRESPRLLHARNENGAAPIHHAYLHQKYDIGKTLMKLGWETNVECATLQYTADKSPYPGSYIGENILHIAIVQQNLEEVKWLLARAPDLLKGDAWGTFFQPATVPSAYFGGFPFLFAASTNQVEMLECMLELDHHYYNDIALADNYGNTALHLAVIHDSPGMYHYILEKSKTVRSESLRSGPTLPERFNNDGLTPLALAAAMGRVRLFSCILEMHTKNLWNFGPTSCCLVPLRGLEQPYALPANSWRGKAGRRRLALALDCMCADEEEQVSQCQPMEDGKIPSDTYEGRLNMVLLPDIRTIIDAKWDKFGNRQFLRDVISLAVVMVLWTVATMIPNHYMEDPENLSAYPVNNAIILFCEGIVLLWVFYTVGFELRRLAITKQEAIGNVFSVVSLILASQMLFCLLILALVGVRAALLEDASLVLTAVASLVGWTCLLLNMAAFRAIGPLLMTTRQFVIGDIAGFALPFFVLLLGLATAAYIVQDLPAVDPGAPPGNATAIDYFLMFRNTFILSSNTGLEIAEGEGGHAWQLEMIVVVVAVIQAIIMTNILLAMLSDTYLKVSDRSEALFYVHRWHLMRLYESVRSAEHMDAVRDRYSVLEDGMSGPDVNEGPFSVFNADRYFRIIATSEQWKRNVQIKQQFRLFLIHRAAIEEEQAETWRRVLLRQKAINPDTSYYGSFSKSFAQYIPHTPTSLASHLGLLEGPAASPTSAEPPLHYPLLPDPEPLC